MAFFISEDLDAGLKTLKEEYEAESIRRALMAYLQDKGVLKGKHKGQRKGGKRR